MFPCFERQCVEILANIVGLVSLDSWHIKDSSRSVGICFTIIHSPMGERHFQIPNQTLPQIKKSPTLQQNISTMASFTILFIPLWARTKAIFKNTGLTPTLSEQGQPGDDKAVILQVLGYSLGPNALPPLKLVYPPTPSNIKSAGAHPTIIYCLALVDAIGTESVPPRRICERSCCNPPLYLHS